MGYNDKPFRSATVETEDLEADKAYDEIQNYMDERRKRYTQRSTKKPEKRREITAGEILADVKQELLTITDGTL